MAQIYRREMQALLAFTAPIALLVAAAPAAAAQVKAFDIPKQSLSAALIEFARQSDTLVVVAPQLAAGKQSQAVKGPMTIDQGLQKLLFGTQLRAIANPQGGYRIDVAPRVTAAAASSSAYAGAATAQAAPEPAAAPVQEDSGLGDIIVTAQKRAENVQDVPIAITAVDSAKLENTAASISTTNLQQFVPGLVQGRAGTAGATFLRGVGSEAGVAGTESPVATYLDGIYLGVNALGVFELNNIDQVSVLKGPQGTLFGRNATGGAIQITTKNPNLSNPEVKAEIGYGNYDTVTGRLYASTPITDTLGANISVLYKNRGEGTVYNVATGNDLQAERIFTAQGKILWEPTDNTRIMLNYIHSEGDDLPGLNYFVQKGALAPDGENTYVGPRTVNLFVDSYMSTRADIGALTISHDFGFATLTNILTRTEFQNRSFNDQSMRASTGTLNGIGAAAANLNADIEEITEELQLVGSDDSALKWIVGFFYFNDKTDTSLQNYNYPATGPRTIGYRLNSRLETESYAGYAQATYEILPNTNLTGGLRFTHDIKRIAGTRQFTPPTSAVLGVTVDPEASFDKLTWRLSLDHQFTDDVMAYASWNRGFRAGAYSPLALTNPAARPETLDAYEVGLKSDFFDRKLRLNASAFFYKYSDLQYRQNSGSPVTTLIRNAANAEIYGLDVDIEARPTPNLRLTGGFELLKAEYKSFPGGPANYPVGEPQIGLPVYSGIAGCTGTPRTGVGGHTNNLGCDLSGNSMINAPEFSAAIGIEYTIPTSFGNFVLSAGDKYTGKSFASPDNFQILEAYHYVTASIGWTSVDEHFFGKIWGTNLAEPDRPAQMAYSLNTYEFLPNEPTFYGVTFGYKF